MAGGLSIGIIGGSPLMKVLGAGGKVTGNRLPLTKSLDGGGGLGDMMSRVMGGGGLQSFITNPMGALTGALGGQISGAAAQLSNIPGAGGLISKLTGTGGLSDALGSLTSTGDGLLSGQGILAQIGHVNITDMVGSALPAGLGIDTVLGPLNADALLTRIGTTFPTVVQSVAGGSMSLDAASAWVDTQISAITAVVDASANALSTVATAGPDIAAVSTIAAAVVSAPPEIQAVLQRAVDPAAYAVMQASVATHMDES